MKPEKAIEILNKLFDKCDLDQRCDEEAIEATNEALEALEMRVPVKPETDKDSMSEKLYKIRCPKCGAVLAHGNSVIKYTYRVIPQSDICYMCGQMIDWEGTE